MTGAVSRRLPAVVAAVLGALVLVAGGAGGASVPRAAAEASAAVVTGHVGAGTRTVPPGSRTDRPDRRAPAACTGTASTRATAVAAQRGPDHPGGADDAASLPPLPSLPPPPHLGSWRAAPSDDVLPVPAARGTACPRGPPTTTS